VAVSETQVTIMIDEQVGDGGHTIIDYLTAFEAGFYRRRLY
jgi:hypothetical protein